MLKKFRILLFFVLLLVLLGTCSIGYADSMWTQVNVKNGINNIDIVNAVINNFNINVNSYTGSNLTRYNDLLDYVENTDAYMTLWLTSGTNGPFLKLSLYKKDDTTLNAYCMDTGFRVDHSSKNKYLNYSSGWSTYNRYNNTMYAFSSNAINNTTLFTLNDCVYAFGFNMQGQYFEYNTLDNFSVSSLSNFKYNNSWSGTISIRYNNTPHDFYKVTKSRSTEKWWQLGYIQGYEDYLITGYLGQYVDYDIIDDTFARADYLSENNIQNGNTLAFVVEGDKLKVYVNQYNIQYNRCYRLQIAYRQNSNDDSDYINIPYYFTPYGDTSTSGEFIPITTDLDLDWIRTWEAQTNFDSITADNINSPFSNSFGSGEFFGITYNDNDHWGFGDLFAWFWESLYNLITNFDNVTINFGFLGNISSSQFVTNTTFAAFIGLFSNAFLLIVLIFWYYRLIHSISILDLNALDKYDLDNMFNLF